MTFDDVTKDTHSCVKKAHDWVVDQVGCLPHEYEGSGVFGDGPPNRSRPIWKQCVDPNLNGHLHYPNDMNRSLNEDDNDKIRKYFSD